jgi:hypothetical protein
MYYKRFIDQEKYILELIIIMMRNYFIIVIKRKNETLSIISQSIIVSVSLKDHTDTSIMATSAMLSILIVE